MNDSGEHLGLRVVLSGALSATWRIRKDTKRRILSFLASSTP